MPTQAEIFLTKEGDQWFVRNRQSLESVDKDRILACLRTSNAKPQRILDIGCSFGKRLNQITAESMAQGYGLDTSAQAIKYGREKYPHLRLARGVAHDLTAYEGNFFDLVIISFVFHWLDRQYLLRTVSEIDRVLAPGGRVIIQDFYPSEPCRVKYHHLPDDNVFTFKQNYPAIFLASRLYGQVYSQEFLHSSRGLNDNQNRCHLVVLEKQGEQLYPLYE